MGAHLRDVARRTLTPENYPWLAGAVLALAAEARAPRSQLAVFVLPRALTAAYWAGAAHRSGRVPLEDGLLAAGAMAVLSDRVRWNDGRDLNPVVRRSACPILSSRALVLTADRLHHSSMPLPTTVLHQYT